MIRQRVCIVIGLLGFGFCAQGIAQEEIKALPRFMYTMAIDYMNPQPPIRKFSDANDWGYHISAQYRVMYNEPFMAGLYYSEAGLSRAVKKYTDNGTDIREKANTRRIEAGIAAGVYPEFNWMIQPYIQGRLGMAWFPSASILTDRDSKEQIERISESNDHALSYGLDLGLQIVPNIWYVRGDIRVGFVANPSVTYRLLNADNLDSVTYPIDAFEYHTSAGRWLKVSVGVSYLF
jgi:hypothetical protein